MKTVGQFQALLGNRNQHIGADAYKDLSFLHPSHQNCLLYRVRAVALRGKQVSSRE